MIAAAKTIEVGGVTYEVLPLPSMTALRVTTRVLKMIAPAFASVSSLRGAASAVGTLLANGAEGLDEEVNVYLCAEFSKVTKVIYADGRKLPLEPIFDEHFRGRFWDSLAWVKAAAEVTFGPFGEIPARMMPAGMVNPSVPPATPGN